ncbi:MAG: NAD(P)H-hydrate dehydratase [Ignavibacteria bacterium]|nr:NAD(P)H-hydrate dehydratase [Ignavibacteria bacterium]
MRSVFFNTEILEAEKKIIENNNIPSIILMENAGANSARFIKKFIFENNITKCILLSGKGNNAGDGFVIARHLSESKTEILILSMYPLKELKGDAFINYNILKNLNVPYFRISEISSLKEFKKILKDTKIGKGILIIDAVFGVGFRGELDKHLRDIFNFLNTIKSKKVIAVDTVSGLKDYNDSRDLLKADITISMSVNKFNSLFGKGRETSGKIETVDIGIPSWEFDRYNERNIYETEQNDMRDILPERNINSNKYSNGKLFILGGKKGFSGAVYLSSMSAMRTGCGAVIAGIPESINKILEIKTTEVITLPLPENKNKCITSKGIDLIREKIKWSDATLVGPGIGRDADTQELIIKILEEFDHKFIIDADGLNALKGKLDIFKKKNNKTILTPHYGEFSVLSGCSVDEIKKDIYKISTDFAKKYNVILVLKNSPTIITDGKYFYINRTGRENLATIGSGDVLSGIISSVYSVTGDAVKSSVYGCYLHGKCGDNLFRKTGSSSTLAGDLIDFIPETKLSIKFE